MGVYARYVGDYVAAGLVAIPVDTRAKKPAVKGWQKANSRTSLAWARRCPDASGIGILAGERSGVVSVDVDMAGEAARAAALEHFGETPVVIGTASGKTQLWYRHSGERRRIRVPGPLLIDVLGEGIAIAPPSEREDLGASYRFLTGSLDDLGRLPAIRPGALDALTLEREAQTVLQGERNQALFRHCMVQARHCDDLEGLIDVAVGYAEGMPVPLLPAEVERVAGSAWRYQVTGRNFVGLRKPQVTADDRLMDALIDCPEAYTMLRVFIRYHSGRPHFAIAPRQMAEAEEGVFHSWSRGMIERGRKVLLARGMLVQLRAPSKGKAQPGLYALAEGVHRAAPIMPETGHNHLYTASREGEGVLSPGATLRVVASTRHPCDGHVPGTLPSSPSSATRSSAASAACLAGAPASATITAAPEAAPTSKPGLPMARDGAVPASVIVTTAVVSPRFAGATPTRAETREQFACPDCGAAAGEPCDHGSGPQATARTRRGTNHQARFLAAVRAQEAMLALPRDFDKTIAAKGS